MKPLATDLFSDYFAREESFLGLLDPRLKLIAALWVLVLAIGASGPGFSLLLLVTSLAGMLSLRVPIKLILKRLLPPTLLAFFMLLLKALYFGVTPFWSFSVGGFGVTLYAEGLSAGVLILARVMGAVGVLLLLSFCTAAHDLFRALAWMRLSPTWVEIALLTYRYIFVFIEQAAAVKAAQTIRLGYHGVRRSMHSAGVLAGSVVLRSYDQSLQTHEAMRVRGYRGSMPFVSLAPLAAQSWSYLALFGCVSGIFYGYLGKGW